MMLLRSCWQAARVQPLSEKWEASWWLCSSTPVTSTSCSLLSGQVYSVWKGLPPNSMSCPGLQTKQGNRPWAGERLAKPRARATGAWATDTPHALSHTPGKVLRSSWVVKISRALFTGWGILTQHLHQRIWEHLACASSIIHSIKLLVLTQIPNCCVAAGMPAVRHGASTSPTL